MENINKEFGRFCRDFRTHMLLMTLKDVSELSGVNVKTLSAFENGRSTNINHLKSYLKCCPDYHYKHYLISGIIKILEV